MSKTAKDFIESGESITSCWVNLTENDKKWLAKEVKAGRVYKCKDPIFMNMTIWIRSDLKEQLEAERVNRVAKYKMISELDDIVREHGPFPDDISRFILDNLKL